MRTPDSVRAAQNARNTAWNWASVRGLPPGYIEGFKMDAYRGKPRFTDGICSVMGMPVEVEEDHVVSSGRYERTRVAERRHYCYLDKKGTFFVDLVKPVYRGTQHAKYHPSAEYRYLGFFFLDCDKDLIFWRGQDVTDVSDIIIARDDFEGYSDYACSGDEDSYIDHEYFQDAIDYASAIGGARILVRAGTYYFGAAASYKSNVTISGDNAGGVVVRKNCADYAFKAAGTSGNEIENIGLEGLKILNVWETASSYSIIRFDYADGFVIKNCEFVGDKGFVVTTNSILTIYYSRNGQVSGNKFRNGSRGIYLNNCKNSVVADNFIYDLESQTVFYGIDVQGVDTDSIIITNNCIYDNGHSLQTGYGIRTQYNTSITNNEVRNNLGHGIYVKSTSSYAKILSNVVTNNYDLTTNKGIGIQIASSVVGAQVKTNTCIDNGNLIDRGNCESATSPMWAGETVIVAASNATWAKSTADKYEGSASWLLTKSSAAGAGDALQELGDAIDSADMHGLVTGLEYTITCYGKVPTAGTIGRYKVYFRQYHTGAWHDSIIAMTGAAAWELLTINVTLNASATGVLLRPFIETDEAVDSLFYLDNIRVQPIGVHNEHSQQFSDAGTDTALGDNSWQ